MNMALVQDIETTVSKNDLVAQHSPEPDPFKKVVQLKYFRFDLIGKNQGVRF